MASDGGLVGLCPELGGSALPGLGEDADVTGPRHGDLPAAAEVMASFRVTSSRDTRALRSDPDDDAAGLDPDPLDVLG